MKLSDIMGNANLSIYAEVAMVIFLLVFLAIAVRLWLPGRQQALQEAARLPLDDDPTPAATPPGSTHG
jgi:cbb3-type cytochrome oxidase subunit 3